MVLLKAPIIPDLVAIVSNSILKKPTIFILKSNTNFYTIKEAFQTISFLHFGYTILLLGYT